MGPSLRLRHGQSLNNNNTTASNRGNPSSTGPPPPPPPKRAAAAVVKKEPDHRGGLFKAETAEEPEVIAAEIVVWTGNDEVEMEDDGEEDAVSVASSGELSSVPDSPLSVRSTPVPGRGESPALEVAREASSELSLEEGIPEKGVEGGVGGIKAEHDVGAELEVEGQPEVEGRVEVDGESRADEGLPVEEEEELVGGGPQIEDEPQIEDKPKIEEGTPPQTMDQMDGQEPESVHEAEPEKAAYVSRTDETGPISPMTTVRLTS